MRSDSQLWEGDSQLWEGDSQLWQIEPASGPKELKKKSGGGAQRRPPREHTNKEFKRG